MTVLFLYTELADYFLKCCDELSERHSVHIVCWPVNKEAPFKFDSNPRLNIYQKQQYGFNELNSLVRSIKPDVLVCSGWIDRDYLKVARRFFGKIPTVMTCDTRWTGSLRQRVALVLSRIYLMSIFSHAWVPGSLQAKYAGKLGFKKENIRRNFYCCDLKKFNAMFSEQKSDRLPRRFLYVGRYYEFKGLPDLWQAFIQLQNESPSEWELWCLGTGDLQPVEHPLIKHFGFVQPRDLGPILSEAGVFILPSRFEPWGVVVQEYAAAGFPLLLSQEVGASEIFLREGKNGFGFQSKNPESLKKAMKKIIDLDAKNLTLMARESHRLAQQVAPAGWVATLEEIYDQNKKE